MRSFVSLVEGETTHGEDDDATYAAGRLRTAGDNDRSTVVTLKTGRIGGAIMPFTVGLLLAVVAYGRWSALNPSQPAMKSAAACVTQS